MQTTKPRAKTLSKNLRCSVIASWFDLSGKWLTDCRTDLKAAIKTLDFHDSPNSKPGSNGNNASIKVRTSPALYCLSISSLLRILRLGLENSEGRRGKIFRPSNFESIIYISSAWLI